MNLLTWDNAMPDLCDIETKPRDTVYVRGLALALCFSPEAIRDHFDVDDPDPTANLTYEQLAYVGEAAINDDCLYQAFHAVLCNALRDVAGVDIHPNQ